MVSLDFSIDIILPVTLWPLVVTQHLTEIGTRNTSWEVKLAGAWGWQPCHLHVPIVLKSSTFKLLEPSGPVQACTRIALPFHILRGFKTSDDAFRLSYSIAFNCSIRPFLDLFHSWLYIFHLSRFSGDGPIFSFLQVTSES